MNAVHRTLVEQFLATCKEVREAKQRCRDLEERVSGTVPPGNYMIGTTMVQIIGPNGKVSIFHDVKTD